jgi:hypothetical protein
MGFISPDISFRVEQNCQECGEKWIDPHEPDPNSTVTGVDKPNIE